MNGNTNSLANQIIQAANDAGIEPDDDIGKLINIIGTVCGHIDSHMVTLEKISPPDIERAVRVALMGLRPAFEHRWRWQRWATMIGVSAAGGCVASVLILASWTLSEAVTRREASAEAMRWQSWWIATCSEKSPRRVVVDGKLVCQVPMDQVTGKSQ